MKNYEKYADVIKTYNNGSLYCNDIIIPNVLEPLGKSCNMLKPLGKPCVYTGCEVCNSLTTLWLLEDYEEPETDWSKVEVDTPILVRDGEDEEWNKQHFAECDGKVVCAWCGGKTSWTEDCVMGWKYAKLAEGEGAE